MILLVRKIQVGSPRKGKKKPTKVTSTHHVQSSGVGGRQAGGRVEIFIITGFMVIPAPSQEVVKNQSVCLLLCQSGNYQLPRVVSFKKDFLVTLKSPTSVSPCNKLLPAAKPPRAASSLLLIVSLCGSLCFAFLINFFFLLCLFSSPHGST